MSAATDTTKQKIECFESWMKGDHVLVHLDSRKPGVQVPPHLKDNPSLTLKLSYGFQGETTHDAEQISVYLKFAGQYQLCLLPWAAIWGLTNADSENKVWPADLPKELLKDLALSKLKEIGGKIFSRGDKSPEPATAEQTAPAGEAPDDGKKKRAPMLKRIK
ncbi:MAG: hypothetical protein U0136_11830 [Bdellovibrionota bacterium]